MPRLKGTWETTRHRCAHCGARHVPVKLCETCGEPVCDPELLGEEAEVSCNGEHCCEQEAEVGSLRRRERGSLFDRY